jgi:DNA-directed RNA polymerase sigma subunit (sigma70/sigma32)
VEASILGQFIENNESLINDYDMVDNSLPLEYCEDEIMNYCQRIMKNDKGINIQSVLVSALNTSIRYNINILDSLETIYKTNEAESTSNITQQYFKEINNIYNKHHNNFNIEYCEENRNKLLEMNLKSVISIAKKYQGLGLTLQELISAGNLGLVTAWDKFDPNRSKLKDNIINSIQQLPDQFTTNELLTCINEFLQYGDIEKKFLDRFPISKQPYTKSELMKWINSNIHNAKFNSIAVMWIKAYILIEIDNNSRVVKKPKAEIYKDKEKHGAYQREITLDIDAPSQNDSDQQKDIFYMADDRDSDLEIAEAYNIYKKGLNLLLEGVPPRDRAIFLKKFGIGLPRPMLPKEIADQEELSIARVSQIFKTVMDQIRYNQKKYNVNPDILFSAVQKFK